MLGSNSDFYLDNSTGSYYKKISSIWLVQGNLIGPPGLGTAANTTALQNQINTLNQNLLFTQLSSGGFNLFSYWKFDNNVLDSSGIGNHGIVAGTPTYVTGRVGQAFSFDGSRYITTPGTGIPTGSSDRSIAFWIYPTSFTGSSTPFGYGSISVNNLFSCYLTDGTGFVVAQGLGNDVQSNTALSLNNWSHVVITLSSSGTVSVLSQNQFVPSYST